MIENLVDSFIEEKRNNYIEPDKFRASDAGRCHLYRYWKRQRKPYSDEFDEKKNRILEIGNMFHDYLQNILEYNNIIEFKELEVEDRHRIGHVDAIVNIDNKRILYEFKTANHRSFTYASKDNNTTHCLQVYTYASLLPFPVDDIRLVYISKDDFEIKEFSVIVDNTEELVKADWQPLIEAWEKQEEPKPNPAEWECKYCVYVSGCNKR